MIKTKFWEQAERLMMKYPKLKKNDFEKLYEIVHNDNLVTNPVKLIDKLIFQMFPDGKVDWVFFDSEIGMTFLKSKLYFEYKLYTAPQVMEITNKSKGFIYAEIKAGRLIADGNKMIRHDDLMKFIKDKGYDKEDPGIFDKALYKEKNEVIISPISEREEEYGK